MAIVPAKAALKFLPGGRSGLVIHSGVALIGGSPIATSIGSGGTSTRGQSPAYINEGSTSGHLQVTVGKQVTSLSQPGYLRPNSILHSYDGNGLSQGIVFKIVFIPARFRLEQWSAKL